MKIADEASNFHLGASTDVNIIEVPQDLRQQAEALDRFILLFYISVFTCFKLTHPTVSVRLYNFEKQQTLPLIF